MDSLQQDIKRFTTAAIATTLVTGGVLHISQAVVQAQAAYGSYIGGGLSVGLTADEHGEGQQLGALVAGRYKLMKAPISLRTQAFIGSDSVGVVPTVSYDIPLNWQTDAYVGAGYSITTGDKASPVGNSNSLVIQPGIDYTIPDSKMVLFTNAVFALDAYENEDDMAIAVQGGLGLQF